VLTKDGVQLTGDGDDCNKYFHPNLKFIMTAAFRDTGNKVRLRRYSRGIFAIVRAGGHIESFAPLYRSESPTQVHIISYKSIWFQSKSN
jgi:hypothetical protein